jgi:hypothetical protein
MFCYTHRINVICPPSVTVHQSFNGGNAAGKANDLLQAANSDAMKAALAELRGVTLAPTADPNSVVDSDLSSHAFYFIIAFYVLLVVAACVMWRRGMFSRTTTGDTDEWVQVEYLGGCSNAVQIMGPLSNNQMIGSETIFTSTRHSIFEFRYQRYAD